MLLFKKKYDGGKDSGVNGYWVVEIKSLFSIVLLKFNPNNRENFHSHAFNALTFWLKGSVVEECIDLKTKIKTFKSFKGGQVKYTPVENIHKIHCKSKAWALCFRGPWSKTWVEYNEDTGKLFTLTNGRKFVNMREV